MFGFGGMLCWVQILNQQYHMFFSVCFYFVFQRILNKVEVFNKTYKFQNISMIEVCTLKEANGIPFLEIIF